MYRRYANTTAATITVTRAPRAARATQPATEWHTQLVGSFRHGDWPEKEQYSLSSNQAGKERAGPLPVSVMMLAPVPSGLTRGALMPAACCSSRAFFAMAAVVMLLSNKACRHTNRSGGALHPNHLQD